MTRLIKGICGPDVVVIEDEDKRECQTCHKVADCRPYGPNWTDTCYDCAMKDREGTEQRMAEKMFGVKLPPDN